MKVYVEDMQFGFMPGKASTEAMFFCQLREKFRAKDKKGLLWILNLSEHVCDYINHVII